MPLFSLYADPYRSGEPMLPSMARAAKMETVEFLVEYLLRPFADQWLTMVIDEGVVLEPHAQNLLLEIGVDGIPTRRIVHRDFEDVYVDYRHRALCGRALPQKLPMATDFRVSYLQREHRHELESNLHSYFLGGIIFNIQRRLPVWRAAGLVDGRVPRITLERLFLDLVEAALRRKTGREVRIRGDYRALTSALYEARRDVRKFRSLFLTDAWQNFAYLQKAFPRNRRRD
jgi:hypothetical protein